MQVINPAYAHDSSVGPVFDVGAWAPPGWCSPSTIMALAAGSATAAAAAAVLLPDILSLQALEWAAPLRSEIELAWKSYPWWMGGGALLAVAVAYLFLAGGIAHLRLRSRGEFYLRTGPGGLSMRVPDGLSMLTPSFAVLELDAAWDDVAEWRVVQHKRLGSISPNAGNLDAELRIVLRDGRRHVIDLSWFREPARIIWNRIQEAVEMVPMSFEGPAAEAPAKRESEAKRPVMHERRTRTSTVADMQHDIEAALRRVLECGDGFVCFTDPATDRFIQFCDVDGALWLDLPGAALTDEQWRRAADFIGSTGLWSTPAESFAGGQAAVAEKTDIQANLGTDVARAARVVIDTFQRVYETGTRFELDIHEQPC